MLCRAAPLFRGYDFARPFSFMNGLKRSKAPDAFTGSGLAPTPYNLIRGVVMLSEKGAQTIMRQCFYFVVVAADHVVIVDKGVDDGFLGSFDSGGEKGVHQHVPHSFFGANRGIGICAVGLGGGT